jgi:hypothetical protein
VLCSILLQQGNCQALLHPFSQSLCSGEFMKLMRSNPDIEVDDRTLVVAARNSFTAIFPRLLAAETSNQLQRMFRDPRVLEPHERRNLIAQLTNAVELAPEITELRVLLGMALSVDLQAHEAMEQLRKAVEQFPDSFIARLKYGELLMRLRICQRAAEETHQASLLAVNAAQSELARRQAATIRTMLREGVERGGHGGLLSRVFRLGRRSKGQTSAPVFVGTK